MKLATYNIEWFNTLFDDAGQVIDDDSWSSRWNVTKADQSAAIAQVLKAIDADAVMIIEAPDTSRNRDGTRALETFAKTFQLRTTDALTGFTNDTQQEISLLYDPTKLTATHTPGASTDFPRFDQSFALDIDLDATRDPIVWSKPPLEVTLTAGSADPLHLIGVHAKSKAPHGARNADEATTLSIANRRKQLAQCIWLRGRVEEHLSESRDLIVMGDFNDGPGLDEYEKLFGRSGVEIVMGEDSAPDFQLFDPHAHQALTSRIGTMVSTSRFFLRDERRYLNALLDYIMVSPALKARNPNWHIWHPFDDRDCWDNPLIRDALLTASDHFPVTLTL